MTPQLVWATCENAHQFVLWSAIKMVAGEDGTCILGTRDLAALAMLSVGTVHQARQALLRLGLLKGELCRDPGYPNAVWHLRVPDLWAANHAWREAHPALRERIEYKSAQKERARSRDTLSVPQKRTETVWPPGAPRSGAERQRSAAERFRSAAEPAHSEAERSGSRHEPKEIPVLDPIEEEKRSLDTAWKNALVELALQLPKPALNSWIRPLRPGGWHEGPDGARAVLLCPNPYVQEWCRERLGLAIQRVLGGVLERPGLFTQETPMDHDDLQGAGQVSHTEIDRRLPDERQKALLAALAQAVPATVSGARDNPEGALANLLAALETLGLIVDSTTAT
jgi:hypothetical protein